MEIEDIVAANIKIFRERKGLTQEKLSEKCGSSKNYISQLEQKNRFPSSKMLKKLSESLEIEIFEFFIDQNSKEVMKKRKRVIEGLLKSFEKEIYKSIEEQNIL